MEPGTGFELTGKARFLCLLIPTELRFVEKEKSVLTIESPTKTVSVYVLRIDIALKDCGLELEPCHWLNGQSRPQRSHWEARPASRQIHIHEGGPAKGAVQEQGAVVRNDEFSVSGQLSEANGDFVIQQILLEPEFIIPQRVKSGVVRDREKVPDEILGCIFPTQQEPCRAQTGSPPSERFFEVEFHAKIEQTGVDRSGY